MIKVIKDLLFRYEVIVVEDLMIENDGCIHALISLYEDDLKYMVASVYNEHDKQPSYIVKIDSVKFEYYVHDNDLSTVVVDELDAFGNHNQTVQTLKIEDCINEVNVLSYIRNSDQFEIKINE